MQKKTKIKNICVFMFGGIGNYIMTTPLLSAIKEKFSCSKVFLVVAENSIAGAAKGSGLVDEIINLTEHSVFHLLKLLRAKRFDLTITTTGTNPFKTSLLSFLSGAKYRVGENTNRKGFFYNIGLPYNYHDHEVIGNLKLLSPFNIYVSHPKLIFHISSKEKRDAKSLLEEYKTDKKKKIIAIHPGSGECLKFKRWDYKRFGEIAKKLIEKKDAAVLLLGGTNETFLTSSIINLVNHKNIINMAGKLSLKETGAILQECNLLITNDTAIMHIASAVSVKTVALFGPTMSHKTGPFGNENIVLKGTSACIPCYKYKYIKCDKNIICMDEIKVLDVYNSALKLLQI